MPGHPARPVEVTARQEELLRKLVRGTKTPQRLAQRAQIVLLAAEGRPNEHIVEQLAVTRPMVRKWRRRWSQAEDQLRAVEEEEPDSAVQNRICEILADAPRSGRPADILSRADPGDRRHRVRRSRQRPATDQPLDARGGGP